MYLITQNGRRIDHQVELEQLIQWAQIMPYELVTSKERQRLKTLLDLQHQEREYIRFGDDDNDH